MSSNERAAYRETPKVPQSLQFTEHLRDRVSNMNIISLHSSLWGSPGYNHIIVKYWQWSRALSKSLDAHPTAASLSNHRRVAAFYNIHWSPKASEQTCLAESCVTTGGKKKKKSLNLINSESKEWTDFLYLCFDWQLTSTIIFCSQNVQTTANKPEANNCWHQLSLWQWTHPLSPLSGKQKI